MNLIYFTKEAQKCLKRDLSVNESKYYSSDDWLDEYFSLQGMNDYCRESSVVVPTVELVYNGDDDDIKNRDDLMNVKMLYGAYKNKLTPLQASDPLLWTALCHITFKNYILKRWKKDNDKISISKRFFATEARNSLLSYNAISRLWWSGYLTYDKERESTNPWHFTETLFSAQQIQKDLFDQPFSMNRTIVNGLLAALGRIQDENGNSCTKIFRDCCDSYLNHYGAVSILDTLHSDDVEKIAYDYMKGLLK